VDCHCRTLVADWVSGNVFPAKWRDWLKAVSATRFKSRRDSTKPRLANRAHEPAGARYARFSPEISHAAGIANPESFRGNLQVAIPGQTLAVRPACRQTGANFTT